MRDEQKRTCLISVKKLHHYKKLFSIVLMLFLVYSSIIPLTLATSYNPENSSFLIEFTTPGLLEQLQMEKTQLKHIHNFYSRSFTRLIENISSFQQSALAEINKIVDINQATNTIEHFQLFINGIRISDISTSSAEQIQHLPFVKRVERDRIIYVTHQSNGIDTIEPCYMPMNNSSSLYPISSFSGRNISIAFFDTGIDYTHPALSSVYCGGYDFVNDDKDPFDDNGHGTHVSGITAAQPTKLDSDFFMSGIAPNASVYSYKVLDKDGFGYTSWFLSAFETALDPNNDGNFSDHMDIISMSAGNPEGSESDLLSLAAIRAVKSGITVVAAAGNNGPDIDTISSPAIASEVIAVGATIGDEKVASYSSCGSMKKSFIKPDIVAPGDQIISTWPNNQYQTLSGTSMATPYVTGIIACILEQNPTLTPLEIQTLIHSQTVPIENNITKEGYGLVKPPEDFQIKTPLPARISAVQKQNANTILLNISLQPVQEPVLYTVTLSSVDQTQSTLLETNEHQIEEKDTLLNLSIPDLPSGYHVITVILYNQEIFTYVKQIIYLENQDQHTITYPQKLHPGDSFVCTLKNDSSPALFFFYIPFRSFQIGMGTDACFRVPLLPFTQKEEIIATLTMLKLGLPITHEKYNIPIITGSAS